MAEAAGLLAIDPPLGTIYYYDLVGVDPYHQFNFLHFQGLLLGFGHLLSLPGGEQPRPLRHLEAPSSLCCY